MTGRSIKLSFTLPEAYGGFAKTAGIAEVVVSLTMVIGVVVLKGRRFPR